MASFQKLQCWIRYRTATVIRKFRLTLKTLQTSQIHHLTFICVLDEAGVNRDERSDYLAISTIIEEGQAVDQTDIICAIREADWTQHFIDSCELATLSRMKELKVKPTGGNKWRLIKSLNSWPTKNGCNQVYTLEEMLKWRQSTYGCVLSALMIAPPNTLHSHTHTHTDKCWHGNKKSNYLLVLVSNKSRIDTYHKYM